MPDGAVKRKEKGATMAGASQSLNRLIKAVLSCHAPDTVDAIDFCSGFGRNDLSREKRLTFSVEAASEAECDKRARLTVGERGSAI